MAGCMLPWLCLGPPAEATVHWLQHMSTADQQRNAFDLHIAAQKTYTEAARQALDKGERQQCLVQLVCSYET